MSLTAKDLKVINWYGKENQLIPQLSTPPTIYFKARSSGDTVKVDMLTISTEYNAWNEEDKKQRARERKTAAAAEARSKRRW